LIVKIIKYFILFIYGAFVKSRSLSNFVIPAPHRSAG
jgi:hypothetical protein